MNIFLVRPTTRNIGNDIIAYAIEELFYEAFGRQTNIITVPALKSSQFGGLTSGQAYAMNRLAHGVVVGGGNLFENGQLTYDPGAVEALRPPLLLMALSHGRVAGRNGEFEDRTDAFNGGAIRHLVERSAVAMVRDTATQALLQRLGLTVEVGGCPTLFLPANPDDHKLQGNVIISLRHPLRMSVPPPLQWRIPEDLRRLIAALRAEYSRPVLLACHDYIDLEFAAGFPDATPVYFGDVGRYIAALRNCILHVSYRLHGFLPCLAFGTPSIHLSYDERGQSMLRTVGMEEWDVNLLREKDCLSAVMDRSRGIDQYWRVRCSALAIIADLRRITMSGLLRFRSLMEPEKQATERAK